MIRRIEHILRNKKDPIRFKKNIKQEEGLEKNSSYTLGETKTDDGTGELSKRFPEDIDDFISTDEVSF